MASISRDHSLSLREVRLELEAEAMEEYCLLVCSIDQYSASFLIRSRSTFPGNGAAYSGLENHPKTRPQASLIRTVPLLGYATVKAT